MSPLRLSVLLPFKDAADTLQEAAESLLEQTEPRWELIAVDDGSTDHSREILQKLNDPRIHVLANQGSGIVDALNTGIPRCQAPWIARMDADDRCHPERFEAQLLHGENHPDLSVIGCLVTAFPTQETTGGMRHYLDWLNSLVNPDEIGREIFVESPIAHPSATLRADALRALGGYRGGDFPEDYDLWLRFHGAGHRLGKVNRPLLDWREGAHRLSRKDPRYRPDAFRRLKAQALARDWLQERREVQIWGAGPDGKKWRKALAEEGIDVVRFLDIDPRKIGGRIGNQVPVLDASEVDRYRGLPLLGAVGVKGARAEIRAILNALGWVEGTDHVFVQ